MAEATGDLGAAARGGVRPVLADRFFIDAFAPLSAFDRPSAEAFAAHDPAEPKAALLALVCTRQLPIRAEAADALCQLDVPGLLPLLAFGIIDWPAHDAQRIAFIYRQPLGPGLKTAFAGCGEGGEVDLVRRLLRPISAALHRLAGLTIAHHGVRPDNIWFVDDEAGLAALGCALTGPSGYDQPTAFEPIERATASPAGRGEGSVADDIYALGASVLALTTHQLAAEPADAALLMARIAKGSYAALSESRQVPPALIEPLRGMMADEPSERWSLRDLDAWVDGRRTTVRVARQRRAAAAPLTFAGEAYRSPRQLALALSSNVPEAARTIRDGVVETWLRRDLHEPARAKSLAELVAATKGAPEPLARTDDALVARAALLLDPGIAIHYRGTSFLADGFATALAVQMLQGPAQAMAQALALKLPEAQIAAQADASPDDAQRLRQFREWAAYLKNHRSGFGIERCLYESNRRLPCLSPLLSTRCTIELADLLPALEAVAQSADSGSRPIDRHIAAFIVGRATHELNQLLTDLGDTNPRISSLAMINVLAWLQNQHDRPAPHLAGWVARTLPSITNALHHSETRLAVNREAQRWIARGDLRRLYAVVSDPELWRLDREGFRAAMAAFARCEDEIARLERTAPRRRLDAQANGARVAAVIGCTMASLAVCMTLLILAA